MDERDQDIAYSQGFIETWLENSPSQVKEHLTVISDAVQHYRQKLDEAYEDLQKLRDDYARLTGLTAQYLQIISQYKEVNESLSNADNLE